MEKYGGGPPVAWLEFDKIPKTGSIEVMYVTSPDIQKLELRQELADKICGYKFAQPGKVLQHDEVDWCTLLTDPPPAVIEFVETFNGVYDSIEEPFKIMDASGDGNISRTEMLSFARRIGIGDEPPRTIREPEKWER